MVCHALLISVTSVSTIVNAVVVDDVFLLTCSKVGTTSAGHAATSIRNINPQHIRRYALGGSVQEHSWIGSSNDVDITQFIHYHSQCIIQNFKEAFTMHK